MVFVVLNFHVSSRNRKLWSNRPQIMSQLLQTDSGSQHSMLHIAVQKLGRVDITFWSTKKPSWCHNLSVSSHVYQADHQPPWPSFNPAERARRLRNIKKTFALKEARDKTTRGGAGRQRYVCVTGQNNLPRGSERLHSSHRLQVPASVYPRHTPK